MPFDEEATDAFFEDEDQMSLTPEARARLAKDCITSVLSLGIYFPDNIHRMRATIETTARSPSRTSVNIQSSDLSLPLKLFDNFKPLIGLSNQTCWHGQELPIRLVLCKTLFMH